MYRGASTMTAVCVVTSVLAVTVPVGSASAAPDGWSTAVPGWNTRVSLTSTGEQSTSASFGVVISDDGNHVAFHAEDNLDQPGGPGGLFVRERGDLAVTWVYEASGWGYDLSADGRYLAFTIGGDAGIMTLDRRTGGITIDANPWDGTAGAPTISGDGRYVAYDSLDTSLVPGDTNNASDVFLYDRSTGATTRASVSETGAQADGGSATPTLSGDGRYLMFHSAATNLVPGDTNGVSDVFVRDLRTGSVTRANVSSTGAQAEVPPDGWEPGGSSTTISANGRYVAFTSVADNLAPGGSDNGNDIFLRDRWTGTTTLISIYPDGTDANEWGLSPSISADGRYIVFTSAESDLVRGDTNGASDVFRYDRWTGKTTRVSVSRTGGQANGDSDGGTVSADGRSVAFRSSASNLVRGDTNGVGDVFVRDLAW